MKARIETVYGRDVGWYDFKTGRYRYRGTHGKVEEVLDRLGGFGSMATARVGQRYPGGINSDLRDINQQLRRYNHRLSIAEKQVAKEWQPYEGPQGGQGWLNPQTEEVRYQTDKPVTRDSPVATGRTADGPDDVLPETYHLEPAQWEYSDIMELDKVPLDATVIDRGNGPELVDIEYQNGDIYPDYPTRSNGTVPTVRPIDHPTEADAYVSSSKYDPIDIETTTLHGQVAVNRDEFGRPANQPQREVELPESRITSAVLDDDGYPTEDREIRPVSPTEWGDPFEDKDAALDEHHRLLARLRLSPNGKFGYDQETVDAVDEIFDQWKIGGYDRRAAVWLSAMAMTGRTDVPTQFDTEVGQARLKTIDDETIAAMCDVIRLSQRAAQREFGDEVEVYRGISEPTLEKYVRHNPDGSITVRPQVLESWTVDDSFADHWTTRTKDDWGEPLETPERAGIVVKRTIPTDRVGFYGPYALDSKNLHFKELTMLAEDDDETYTIPAEDIEYYDPAEYTEAEADDGTTKAPDQFVPMLPGHASDWMRATADADESAAKSAGAWEPYEGPQGGEGWRNTQTDEIRYQEQPPGETTEPTTGTPTNPAQSDGLPDDLPDDYVGATPITGSPMDWTDAGFPFGPGDAVIVDAGHRYKRVTVQDVYVDKHGYAGVVVEQSTLGETYTTNYVFMPEKDGWVKDGNSYKDPEYKSFVGVLGDPSPTPRAEFSRHPDDEWGDTQWADAWPEPDPPVPSVLTEETVENAEIKTRGGWADPRTTHNATPRDGAQIRFQNEAGEWVRGVVTDVGYDNHRVYYTYTEYGDIKPVTVEDDNVQKYIHDLPYGTGVAAADDSWLPDDGPVSQLELEAEVLRVAAQTRSTGSSQMKDLIRRLTFDHDVSTETFIETVQDVFARHPTADSDSMSVENNLYHLIGDVIDSELSFEAVGYDKQFQIGNANGDLRQQVIDSFTDEHGTHAWDDVKKTVLSGWASYEGMFSSKTAPLWQAAWAAYDNDYVPKNEDDLRRADVDPGQRRSIELFREHVAEFYRDQFGDTVLAWRGIQSGSRVNELRAAQQEAKQGNPVSLRQMTLTSWTTNPAVTAKFADGDDAIVVRGEIPVEDIWLSSDTTGGMYDSETELVIGTNDEYRRFDPAEVQVASGFDAMAEARVLADWLDDHAPQSTTDEKAVPKRFDFEAASWDWLRETIGLPDQYTPDGVSDADGGMTKEWVPYHGPQGGTGWENPTTGDIVYDDDKPGSQTGSGFTEMARTGYVSTPDGVDLRLETADEIRDLYSERDASPGASAAHMDVAYWYDVNGDETHRAFITNYGSNLERDHTGEKPTLGERAIAADAFLRNIGFGQMVPKHYYDRDDQYLAVEGVGGADVYTASAESIAKVDPEEVRYGAAAVILMGNSDMHGQNVFVESDGTVKFVDLDKSGGDWTDEYTRQRFLNRGVQSILGTARKLGVDMTRDELDQACQEVAQRIDVETALTGVENSQVGTESHHQFRENIRANIQAFKHGSVL